jgi:hypothetical protein
MLGEPETVEVSEGIYAYVQPDGSWYVNNTGFITGGAESSASTLAPRSGAFGPTWMLSRRWGT